MIKKEKKHDWGAGPSEKETLAIQSLGRMRLPKQNPPRTTCTSKLLYPPSAGLGLPLSRDLAGRPGQRALTKPRPFGRHFLCVCRRREAKMAALGEPVRLERGECGRIWSAEDGGGWRSAVVVEGAVGCPKPRRSELSCPSDRGRRSAWAPGRTLELPRWRPRAPRWAGEGRSPGASAHFYTHLSAWQHIACK